MAHHRHPLFLVVAVALLSPARASFPKTMKLPVWNETWVDRIRQNLLLNYDKFSRPTQHYNTTTVFLYLYIMQVEIDSKKSILSVNAQVMMMWNDEKLKWKPEDYGGVEQISVSPHEIWQPDLFLYNSALYGVENYDSRQCIVAEDGTVMWVMPTVFYSYCKLDFVFWPFETNICTLDLASWTHSGDEVNIRLNNEGYDLEYYTAGEWKVQNISASREKMAEEICCPQIRCNCPVVIYQIELKRSSDLYYHIIFVACIPIVFLILVTFWMRPQSEMKLIIIICAIIIDILFLLYFGYKIPARPNNSPLIVKFFSGCLCQMSISIIICGFVIHITTSSYDVSIPWRIKSLLYGKWGKYLGLESIIQEVESQKLSDFRESINLQSTSLMTRDLSINGLDTDDRQSIISQSENVKRLEWILLATAIDRFSFFLFCTIFIFSAILYIHVGIIPSSKTFSRLSSSTISANLTGTDHP